LFWPHLWCIDWQDVDRKRALLHLPAEIIITKEKRKKKTLSFGDEKNQEILLSTSKKVKCESNCS
jgi:hypothetical protein